LDIVQFDLTFLDDNFMDIDQWRAYNLIILHFDNS